MRTRLKTTALAASAAALLAAAPAMASGEMDKQAGDTGVIVPEESAATDREKDALAHRAADKGQSADAGDGESPADTSLSENVDQDNDGNLIATESDKEGSYDGSVAESVDTDQDGNLIADAEKTD